MKNRVFEHQAGAALHTLLEQVPNVSVTSSKAHQLVGNTSSPTEVAWVLEVNDQRTTWTIFAQAINNRYPSRLSVAMHQLEMLGRKPKTYGVLIVPWMSERLETECLALGIGCVDLEGNGVLRFGNVYARSIGKPPPKQETQSLKSLFSSKATRVLRLMLRDPSHNWRTQPLADAADISLGHVHKVTSALAERGWLEKTPQGVRLSQPKDLLETWQESYTPLPTRTFYTLKHGKALQESLLGNDGQHWLYAGFSAADWLAPLVRQPNLYLLADETGITQLETTLALKPVNSGFNVIISFDPEANVLRDRFEATSGIWATSPAQTYLELASGNDRAREAAQHLYKERIEPTWEIV